jgi:hypothetical protein
MLFGGMGMLSVFIPAMVCQPSSSIKGKILFGLALIFFLIAVWTLGFRPPPYEKYLNQWKELREEDSQRASGSPTPGSA